MMLSATIVLLSVIFTDVITYVYGHGRLISPPGRSSMWRYGYSTPKNYNDNQMFCGGFYKQWTVNGGKCGVCGDPWNEARENEAGGKYATGTISGRYISGQRIQVKVQVTATHKGYFEFRLCPVNNPRQRATQVCLDRYLLQQPNGQTKFYEPGAIGTYTVDLVLPQGLTCSQCVLQWKWNTGNSYNCDANHNCCIGCGPQEQFYGCADVSISGGSSVLTNTNNHNIYGSGSIHGNGHVVGFLPIQRCQATALFRRRYPFADQYCVQQCNLNKCPSIEYCTAGCRRS